MTPRIDRARNHLLWVGPLVSLFGFVSYWALFARWPAVRDDPWANLVLLALGVAASAVGLRRAWARSGWRRIAGTAGLVASCGFAGLLIFYCYVWSYGLPESPASLAIGDRVPAVVLEDQRGREVELAGLRGETVLVFYRGYW
jgi:hypothetical protein